MISPGLLLALLLTQAPTPEEAKPPKGMSRRARLYLGRRRGMADSVNIATVELGLGF